MELLALLVMGSGQLTLLFGLLYLAVRLALKKR